MRIYIENADMKCVQAIPTCPADTGSLFSTERDETHVQYISTRNKKIKPNQKKKDLASSFIKISGGLFFTCVISE